MHKEMRTPCGFAAEIVTECEQLLDMHGLRGDCSGVFLDHVVKTELEFLMSGKAAEYLRGGPLRVEDGKNMAHARLAVAGEFIEAADSNVEGQLHKGFGD
jgi:hypothetical protein